MSPIRGPGYYDIQEMTNMQPKKGKYDYFGLTKRFEGHGHYIEKGKIANPGPGQYRGQNDDGMLNKNKSHNLMFN